MEASTTYCDPSAGGHLPTLWAIYWRPQTCLVLVCEFLATVVASMDSLSPPWLPAFWSEALGALTGDCSVKQDVHMDLSEHAHSTGRSRR